MTDDILLANFVPSIHNFTGELAAFSTVFS